MLPRRVRRMSVWFWPRRWFRSRKAMSKLCTSKVHMNSVLTGVKNQPAVVWVAGSLAEEHRGDEGHAASCEDLGNPGHRVGAVQRDDEGWDHRKDGRGLFWKHGQSRRNERSSSNRIDRILFDITIGALGKAPSKVTDVLPEPKSPGAMAAWEDEEE